MNNQLSPNNPHQTIDRFRKLFYLPPHNEQQRKLFTLMNNPPPKVDNKLKAIIIKYIQNIRSTFTKIYNRCYLLQLNKNTFLNQQKSFIETNQYKTISTFFKDKA